MKNKIKVALLRGCYANNYELQNYLFKQKPIKIKTFTSLFPLEKKLILPSRKLLSPLDLPLPRKLLSAAANRLFGDSQMLFGLEKYLLNYDIIHTADPHYYYSYQAAWFKKTHPQKILISTSWETIPHNNETVFAKKQIKDFTKSQVDLFLCYSQKAKNCLLEEGVSEAKIRQLYLGIDTNRFKPTNNRQKIILFVGRLVPEKNPLLLLTAFQKIWPSRPDYQLWFVGKGPLSSVIKQRSLKNHLPVKIFSVPYSQVAKIYQQARLLVLPSTATDTWEEQYGMVMLEAMSSGLPVIGSRTGAIPEILNRETVLFADNNQTDLYLKLHQLLKNPKLCEKIAKMNRERVLRVFNRQLFYRSLRKIYETAYCHRFKS